MHVLATTHYVLHFYSRQLINETSTRLLNLKTQDNLDCRVNVIVIGNFLQENPFKAACFLYIVTVL